MHPRGTLWCEDDLLTVFDLWERYSADGTLITGSLAGVKLMIYRTIDAPADGPHWRLYFAPRQQTMDRDQAMLTTATKMDAPTTMWQGVRTRQQRQHGVIKRPHPERPEAVTADVLDGLYGR